MANKPTQPIFLIPYLIVFVGFLSACSRVEIRNLEDMAAWMYQEENGLQKTREIGDLNLKVNYIPAAYHALREDPLKFNELQKEYDQSLSFIISLSGNSGENILWRGIKDYEGYRERVHRINFDLEELIELEYGGILIHPVLTNVENLYEETDHLKINVIFPKEAIGEFLNGEELTLRIDDRIFKTGLNEFQFDTQKIKNIPTPILAS